MFTNIRMKEMFNLCKFAPCMLVGARWAGLSISETADLGLLNIFTQSNVENEKH